MFLKKSPKNNNNNNQGVSTAMQALSKMSETYPVSFYSRAKEMSYGTNQERLLTSQLDRFFVEWMVEKVNVPRVIDHKVGSEEPFKIAVRTREEFVYKVNDCDKIVSTAMVMAEGLTGRPHSFCVVAKPEGIGMVFTIRKDDSDDNKMKLNRKHTANLPYQGGFQRLVEVLEKRLSEGWVVTRTTNRHQHTQLFRALARLRRPFYFVKEHVVDSRNTKLISLSIPPTESTETVSEPTESVPVVEENAAEEPTQSSP